MSVKIRVCFVVSFLVLTVAFFNVLVFASDQDNPQVKDCDTVSYFEFCEKCNDDIETLQKLIKEHPDNIDYKIWLGNLYVGKYRFEEAIDLANQVLEQSPSCGLAYTLLALAKIQNWRYPKDVIWNIGKIWNIDDAQPKTALNHLKKAQEFSPNDLLPKVMECYVNARFEKIETALQTINGYLSQEPESIEAWFWKGNILFDCGDDGSDMNLAIECYLHIALCYPEAKKQLGALLVNHVHYLFLRKYENDPNFDESQFENAILYTNRVNEALCEHYPDDYLPYLNLGGTYGRKKGERLNELKYYTLSLERRETLAAYSMRSQVYQNLKEIDNAKKDIVRGVEMVSDRVKLCEHFLEGAKVTGNTDLALWWTDESIRVDPNNGDLYNIRGFIYYLKNDYGNALKDCKKAIELGAMPYYETKFWHEVMNK